MKKIEEAAEEPPAKRSKIVEEALKNFKYGYHKIRKNCVEEAAEEPPAKRSKIVEERC